MRPSAFAAIGGYVVTPRRDRRVAGADEALVRTPDRRGYLTDAINEYAKHRAVYGQVIRGSWYDTGNPADYLIAQFASARHTPGYGGMLRELVERSKPLASRTLSGVTFTSDRPRVPPRQQFVRSLLGGQRPAIQPEFLQVVPGLTDLRSRRDSQ